MPGAVCPRGGVLWLRTKAGRELAVETVCKTWTCVACRQKVLALIRIRIEFGCSELGRCVLTTLTLRAGSRAALDADSVSKVWKAFLYRCQGTENTLTA